MRAEKDKWNLKMKVLVFEWLTSLDNASSVDGTIVDRDMLNQGQQMWAALIEDFLLASVQVVAPCNPKFFGSVPDHASLEKIPLAPNLALKHQIIQSAQDCDYILLIAPECDGCLITCLTWFQADDHRLISPGLDFAQVTSSKTSTFKILQANGFEACPSGIRIDAAFAIPANQQAFLSRLAFPWVVKPDDGSGSVDTQRVADFRAWNSVKLRPNQRYRIESMVPGTSVSVSILCGPTCEILAPTLQTFDRLPFGNYVEADYPLGPEISNRAIELAKKTIRALPPTTGYIGLDMIIGSGDQPDFLIEVNPRMTMSYLKLRQIYEANLALAMISQNQKYRQKKTSSTNRDCIFRAPNL